VQLNPTDPLHNGQQDTPKKLFKGIHMKLTNTKLIGLREGIILTLALFGV
jgi:hypothetical protein